MVMQSNTEIIMSYVVKKKKAVSDIIIETSDEKFIRGHKIVLAAASPLLKELLLSAKGDTIVLPYKAEEIKKVVKFVYSGEINISKVCNCKYLLYYHIDGSLCRLGQRSCMFWRLSLGIAPLVTAL